MNSYVEIDYKIVPLPDGLCPKGYVYQDGDCIEKQIKEPEDIAVQN